MFENDFSSMVVLKCFNCLIHEAERNINVDEVTFTRDTTIFNNFKVNINDEPHLIEISISWNELDEVDVFYDFEIDKVAREKSVKSVKECRINLWQFAPNSVNTFMFLQRTNLNKAILVLKSIFRDVNFKRVNLENKFFESIINDRRGDAIGKTINIGYNNINLGVENRFDRREERITEVKIVFHLERDINVKINNKGLIRILNKPDMKEAYEIVEIINNIMLKME